MHLNLKCTLPTLERRQPRQRLPWPTSAAAQPAPALNHSPPFRSHVAEPRGYQEQQKQK